MSFLPLRILLPSYVDDDDDDDDDGVSLSYIDDDDDEPLSYID
jgi:hypothetical protein